MENTQELDPTMGGEDFAYFANEVPGFFYRLGIHREGTRTGPHHSRSSAPTTLRSRAACG